MVLLVHWAGTLPTNFTPLLKLHSPEVQLLTLLLTATEDECQRQINEADEVSVCGLTLALFFIGRDFGLEFQARLFWIQEFTFFFF